MKRIIMIAAGFLVLLVTLTGVTLLTAPVSEAGTAAQTFARANQLYENDQFGEAARLYTQLVDEGVHNSTVYFNLGNALMKIGDWSNAEIAYKKAQALEPRDEAIATNLELLRLQMSETSESPDFFSTIMTYFSHEELAAGAVILWAILIFGIVVLRQNIPGMIQNLLKPTVVLVATLFMASVILLGGQLYTDTIEVTVSDSPTAVAQHVDGAPDSAMP